MILNLNGNAEDKNFKGGRAEERKREEGKQDEEAEMTGSG